MGRPIRCIASWPAPFCCAPSSRRASTCASCSSRRLGTIRQRARDSGQQVFNCVAGGVVLMSDWRAQEERRQKEAQARAQEEAARKAAALQAIKEEREADPK